MELNSGKSEILGDNILVKMVSLELLEVLTILLLNLIVILLHQSILGMSQEWVEKVLKNL